MELLAREKAEQLMSQENLSRRKLRQLQVREQSNEWMNKNRQKYLLEKERQIQLITESLTHDAQEKAVREIEIMERMHDLCAAQVGAAHRAAADLPDFELLRSQKDRENLEKAKSRGAEALAQEKSAAEKALQTAQKLKALRENVRKEEDIRLKEYVARSRYVTRSQHAVDRVVDKLMNKKTQRSGAEYQPSLARTLRVPKESASEAKVSKSLKQGRLSRKPKDVTYYDVSIPHGALKYPPPPGLVQKHAKPPLNAFEAAKHFAAEQKELESRRSQAEQLKARLAETRGKKALKVAKLQRQLEDIQNEFLESGFQVDPKLNDSFLGLSDSSGEGEMDGDVLAVSHEGVQTSPDFPRPLTPPVKPKHPEPVTQKPTKTTKDEATSARRTPPSGVTTREEGMGPPKSPALSPKILGDGEVSTPPKSPLLKSKTARSAESKPTTPVKRKLDESLSLQKSDGRPKTANGGKKSDKAEAKGISAAREALYSPKKKAAVGERLNLNGLTEKPRPESPTTRLVDYANELKEERDALQTAGHLEIDQFQRPASSLSKNGEGADASLDRPKLISTKKSVRLQLEQVGKKTPEGTQQEERINGFTSSGKSTPSGRSTTPQDQRNDRGIPGGPPSTGKTKKSKDSSSSLQTLSSIGSKEDLSEKHVTDHHSPPDSSKKFPVTSTPARDNDMDILLESSTNGVRAVPYTPRTAVRRKKALQYYITKLLEMRPESMAQLEATSSVNFKSSYVEIPTSAVSSIVGSSPPSETSSLSDIEIINETGNTNNSRNSRSHIGTMNGTSDYYTTLSSVTEEEEEEDQSETYESTTHGSSGGTDTLNQVSSGETIAKVTVSVSPRSSNG